MATIATTTRRKLTIRCCYDNDIKRRVKVCRTSTMEDVRLLILERGFDDVLLPDDDSDLDWAFVIDGIRLTSKQERRQLAWNIIGCDIRIVSKKMKNSSSASQQQQPQTTNMNRHTTSSSSHNNNRFSMTSSSNSQDLMSMKRLNRRTPSIEEQPPWQCSGSSKQNDKKHAMDVHQQQQQERELKKPKVAMNTPNKSSSNRLPISARRRKPKSLFVKKSRMFSSTSSSMDNKSCNNNVNNNNMNKQQQQPQQNINSGVSLLTATKSRSTFDDHHHSSDVELATTTSTSLEKSAPDVAVAMTVTTTTTTTSTSINPHKYKISKPKNNNKKISMIGSSTMMKQKKNIDLSVPFPATDDDPSNEIISTSTKNKHNRKYCDDDSVDCTTRVPDVDLINNISSERTVKKANNNEFVKAEPIDPITHFSSMVATSDSSTITPIETGMIPGAPNSLSTLPASTVNPSLDEAFSKTNASTPPNQRIEINQTSIEIDMPDVELDDVCSTECVAEVNKAKAPMKNVPIGSRKENGPMQVGLSCIDPRESAAEPLTPVAAAAAAAAAPMHAETIPVSPAVNPSLEVFSTTRNATHQRNKINDTNDILVPDEDLDDVALTECNGTQEKESMKVEPIVIESIESTTTTTHLNSVASTLATPCSPMDTETMLEDTSIPCASNYLNLESALSVVGGVTTSPPTTCITDTTPAVYPTPKPDLAESSTVALTSIPSGDHFDTSERHEDAPISQSLRQDSTNLCMPHAAEVQSLHPPHAPNTESESKHLKPQMEAQAKTDKAYAAINVGEQLCVSTINTTKVGRPKKDAGPPVPVWEGPPDDPLEGGWPPGWIKRKFKRRSGKSAGSFDCYWYTPKNGHLLRSMVEVRNFMKKLFLFKGDERMAFKNRKNVKETSGCKSEKTLPQAEQGASHCSIISAATSRSLDQQQVETSRGFTGAMHLSFTVQPMKTNDMTSVALANASNQNQLINQQSQRFEWQRIHSQFPEHQQQYHTQCSHSYPGYNHHLEPHTQNLPHEMLYRQYQHSQQMQSGPPIPHEQRMYIQSTYPEYQDLGQCPAHPSPHHHHHHHQQQQQQQQQQLGYWSQPTDDPLQYDLLPPSQEQQGHAPQLSHIGSHHHGHNHDHHSYPRMSPLPSEWEASLSFW